MTILCIYKKILIELAQKTEGEGIILLKEF